MKALRVVFRLGLLIGLELAMPAMPAMAQTTPPKGDQPPAPGLIKLTGDDEKRAKQLDEQIESALKADRWDEAIASTADLLALRARVYGPKHFATANAEWQLKALRLVAPMPIADRTAYKSAKTMDAQASSLLAGGRWAQAQPLFEQALAIKRRLLTESHPDTGNSYNNLANSLLDQGNYAAAQELFEKAIEINRRLLTDDHPDTAASYCNMASTLNAEGKHAAAQPLFESALAIYRRLFTDDHPDTATAYNNLAANLNAQGKYAAAQPLFEKALAICRRFFTDDHPDTATSYSNLAANLNAQGKYAAAQRLYEKALQIRRRRLTDNHPATAQSYSGLGANLSDQGKFSAAQPLYEKALAIDRRLLTDNHPLTAQGYNDLAHNLLRQGNYAQAQPVFEKALAIRRQLLTDNHPLTAQSYNNLASNLDAQGKHAAAQPLFEKALEIRRQLLTDNHPDTALVYHSLAHNIDAQGKHAAAQPLFEKALEINRRLLPENHPRTSAVYASLANNLSAQGKYAAAQVLFEKGLESTRRLFTDDHPLAAINYGGLAANLAAQGKYNQAQAQFEQALAIDRRLLGDEHPMTAESYSKLAANSCAQGKYKEARDLWLSAAKGLDAARVRLAFAGLDRAGTVPSMRPSLAAMLARLGQQAEAWQALEEDLGRGLLDELAARRDTRLATNERDRLRELTAELERLDRLAESTPKDLGRTERAKRYDNLKHQRDLVSIALGEFQTKLVEEHGALAGRVARLVEIQGVLPADAALVAWIDIPPTGPNAADSDGEHWGMVVRSRGTPAWIAIAGTGPDALWTKEDTGLVGQLRTELRSRPGTGAADLRPLVERLRSQRIEPLASALGATTDGQPAARRLIVLPSRALAGIPVEALLASDDTRTLSYAPSATVFKYLRDQPRPDGRAGVLALGDPVYERPDRSSDPKPVPDHGLLVNVAVRGSNASNHGLKDGDVLLAYNGQSLNKKDDLKVVVEGDKPVPVQVWRDGLSSRQELAPGKLGVMIDPRPAPVAIPEQRKFHQVLAAARSGGEKFLPVPGTRREVEAIARLFRSDDRPTRALLGTDASEPELDRLAAANELRQFAFIHLATHGLIDEGIPTHSAVILTQTGLPDPLEQALSHKPVFDGRLSVREIQRTWDLKAELVTLSACDTALGRESGGEGFVGFTQALLMSGARSVCLSLWKVDDKATSLLMTRFYQNLLGKRPALSKPMHKAEALQEAKQWLRSLTVDQVGAKLTALQRGDVRPLTKLNDSTSPGASSSPKTTGIRPYDHPYFWAAFVLVGDPD